MDATHIQQDKADTPICTLNVGPGTIYGKQTYNLQAEKSLKVEGHPGLAIE